MFVKHRKTRDYRPYSSSDSADAEPPSPRGKGSEVHLYMERNAKLKGFSQTLRKEMTKQENLLWYGFLRKHPMQFRRQYIIGNYIVDFYCHKAKLVIELDGSQHYETDHVAADMQRDIYLQQQGLTVLRIPNNAVTENFRGVCEHVNLLLAQKALQKGDYL